MANAFLVVAVLSLVVTYPLALYATSRRKARPRFWGMVDHAWIGLGLFALWFAASELERIQASRTVEATRLEIEANFRRTLWQAMNANTYSGGSGAAAGWYGYCVGVLDLGYRNFKWRWFLGQNEDLWKPRMSPDESRVPQLAVDFPRLAPGDPNAESAVTILRDLDALDKQCDELARLESAASAAGTGKGRRVAFMIALFTLLPLRLAKATVDMRRAEASESRSVKPNAIEEGAAGTTTPAAGEVTQEMGRNL